MNINKDFFTFATDNMIKVTKNGRKHIIKCCDNNEKTSSCVVDLTSNKVKCFSCGFEGSIYELMHKYTLKKVEKTSIFNGAV